MFKFVVHKIPTAGTKPSLRGLHESLAQSHVWMVLNADLQFVVKHTFELVYDLDALLGTNACAPYVSARLDAVRFCSVVMMWGWYDTVRERYGVWPCSGHIPYVVGV